MFYIIADTNKSIIYYHWKISDGNNIVTLDIKQTPFYKHRASAESFLKSIPEDDMFKFEVHQINIEICREGDT